MKFKYIYGPVPSWRLGRSLGIDPISSDKKICTFDCVYCQLGPASPFSNERKVYVKTEKIIDELIALSDVEIDYITFSGMGEPTLAKNLGELIKAVKKLRKEKIAVLTNTSLLNRKDVRDELSAADFVIAKLDAPSQALFGRINKASSGTRFDDIVDGIKKFRKEYKGRLGLQIMFIEENKDKAKEMASLAKEIEPDEIQINTPLRPCAAGALPKRDIAKIKKAFLAMPGFKGDVITVYEAERKKAERISHKDVLKRRR